MVNLLYALIGCVIPLQAEESFSFGPSVTDSTFAPLKDNSPFLRTLELSKSLVLTGLARTDDGLFATILDVETRQSQVISKDANWQGWRILELKGNEKDLETITARIQVAGGEIASIRYEKVQPAPKKVKPGDGSAGPRPPGQTTDFAQAAANFREGISGDGFPGPPPPEVVEKLSKLSNSQRERLIRKMSALREQGVRSEERREVFLMEVDNSLKNSR